MPRFLIIQSVPEVSFCKLGTNAILFWEREKVKAVVLDHIRIRYSTTIHKCTTRPSLSRSVLEEWARSKRLRDLADHTAD